MLDMKRREKMANEESFRVDHNVANEQLPYAKADCSDDHSKRWTGSSTSVTKNLHDVDPFPPVIDCSETVSIISASELAKLLRDENRVGPIVILDFRPPDVYNKCHCIGAENILPLPAILFKRRKGNPDFWADIRQRHRIPVCENGPSAIAVLVEDDQDDCFSCESGCAISTPHNNSTHQRFLSFLLSNLRNDGYRTFRLENGAMAQFLTDYQDLCVLHSSCQNGTNDEHGYGQAMSIRLEADSTRCPCSVDVGQAALSDRQSASPCTGSPFLLPMLKLKDLTLTPDPQCSSSATEGGSKDAFCNKCHVRNGRTTSGRNYKVDNGRLSPNLDISSGECAGEEGWKGANDRDPVNIFSTLYLGNADNASDWETLRRYNIRYILNVTSDLPNQFESNGCSADEGFKYLRIPIVDNVSQNLTEYFPQANDFIDEAIDNKCGILVHCLAGISRSVTFTVAYLMKAKSCGMDEAYDMVKKRKPNIEPNLNFMRQLLNYEHTLSRSDGSGDVTPDSAVSSLSTSSSSICVDSVASPGQDKDINHA